MDNTQILTDPHYVLLLMSGIVAVSYIFDIFSRVIKIPSVLMLIAAGIGFHYLAEYLGLLIPTTGKYLEILGTVGLILIVLEGSLDLRISKKRLPILLRSLATAFFALISTTALMSVMLNHFMGIDWRLAIINSIPFAVISSSIAIPSVIHLRKESKEFIIYESTFSDILGIMFFNFMVTERHITIHSFAHFGFSFLGIIGVSILSCLVLLFFIDRINMHIKFFLVFAVLVAVYTLGKMLNLSALLLVLVFGMAIRNSGKVFIGKLRNFFNIRKLEAEFEQLKVVTAESAFLIRTFFFILFGFSLQMAQVFHPQVWIIGSTIVLILLIVRAINLKFFARESIFPELFVAPRGLVTILLFYSIPIEYQLPDFNEGVLFFVIIITSLLMMLGIAFAPRKENKETAFNKEDM